MWSIAETEKETGLTWKQLQVKTWLFVCKHDIDMQPIQTFKAVIIKLTLHYIGINVGVFTDVCLRHINRSMNSIFI